MVCLLFGNKPASYICDNQTVSSSYQTSIRITKSQIVNGKTSKILLQKQKQPVKHQDNLLQTISPTSAKWLPYEYFWV